MKIPKLEEVEFDSKLLNVNWKALDLTVEASDGTPLQKNVLKRALRKLVKKGKINRILPMFKYRWCAARMYLGDYSNYDGWEWRHEDGWSAEVWYAQFPIPKWRGANCGTLLVRGEQGLGDEIFYSSIIPECLARVDKVILEVDERLHPIFERSFPRLKCMKHEARWDIEADEFITMGDLLRVFRLDKSHFPKRPYLKIDESRVKEFEKYRGLTGVAWKGRQGSIAGDFTGCVSLQYGDETLPNVIVPEIDLTNDIEGVFALCSVLGRVISVPQTVVHIAGSIGKRVDVYLPTIEGEVTNQIRWDMPEGQSRWYKDVFVHNQGETI